MKTKTILSAITIIVFSCLSYSKEINRVLPSIAVDGDKCFDESTKILNVGIGFGGIRYYNYNRGNGYSYSRTPAFSLSYEQAKSEPIGPGYLGIGAYFGFQNAHQRYNGLYYYGNNYYYEHNWNHFVVAARGAYHLDVLNGKDGELYFGTIIGLRIQTYSYNSDIPDPKEKEKYRYSGSSIYPAFSLFAGGRWYFTDNIAMFGEVGYGITYATIGVSFKF